MTQVALPLRRVLFLNHNVRGEGTYLRCLGLGRELARRGISVDIACTNPRRGFFRLERESPEKNLRILLLPEFARTPSYLGCALRTLLGCALVGTRGRAYDLVHAFAIALPSTGLPALLGGLLLPGRLFLDWDDLWGGGLGKHLPAPAHRLLKTLERRLPPLVRPAGLTAPSAELREKFIELGFSASSVRLISNGASFPASAPPEKGRCRELLGLPPGGEIVVSMGRMFDSSLELLLEAFALLAARRPSARMLVVGDLCRYGDLGRLTDRAKARWYALGDRVAFTGGKPPEELPLWLGAADLLVLPLMDSPSDRARFPMRFGDYLVSGRPAVVSGAGEVGRLARETGCAAVSAPGSATSLAEKMLEVLADPARADSLAAAALKLAAGKLSWERIAADLLDFYKIRLKAEG